jgi:hypothetical protein
MQTRQTAGERSEIFICLSQVRDRLCRWRCCGVSSRFSHGQWPRQDAFEGNLSRLGCFLPRARGGKRLRGRLRRIRSGVTPLLTTVGDADLTHNDRPITLEGDV